MRANPGELTGKAAVYVSYSWTAEKRVPVLEDLAAACRSDGLDFQRDTERVKHGDLIRTFMDEIGAAGNIVPVFSREYFQSEYCMYELLQVWKSGGFHQRIHPVRLGDIRLDDVDTQLEFIDYWRDKDADLRAKLIDRDAAVTIELQRRSIVYADIYRHINELMAFVSNMNILPLDSLRQDRFGPLLLRIRAVKTKVQAPGGLGPLASSISRQAIDVSLGREIASKMENLVMFDTARAERIRQLEEQFGTWQRKLHHFEKCRATADIEARFHIDERIRNEIYPELRRINAEYSSLLQFGETLFTEEEAAPLLAELADGLQQHRAQFANYSDLQQQLTEIREAIADSSKTATAKLKVTLPIVPLLANYELDVDTGNVISGIWARIRGLLGKKANPKLPREPDSAFLQSIKDRIREELKEPVICVYARAIERRLQNQLQHVSGQREGDVADQILELTTDVAIGRVLLTATQDCLHKQGSFYRDCSECRAEILQAGKQLLGWIVLASIRDDYLQQVCPHEHLLPALYFEIPVRTPTEVEIIVARRFHRQSKLKLDPSGLSVVGSTQICSGPNAFIWQKSARTKDFQRAVWNAVMGQEKTADLDAAELRQLNEELAFFRDLEYEPQHYYLPVLQERETSGHEDDTMYRELLRDLPNLTLVRFGSASAQGAFVVSEEKVIVAIRHFLTFINQAGT